MTAHQKFSVLSICRPGAWLRHTVRETAFMKVFVTGGAGQVGSTVADLLLARGDTVLSIDNFATGRRDNLAPHPALTRSKATSSISNLVERLFDDFKPDVVVHTAASYKDPDDWYTDALVNAVGTANIAKACKANKVSRLIYFQTALCYGTKPQQSPIQLDHPINPVNSSYAISKTAGRALCAVFGRRLGDLSARQRDRSAQRVRPAADFLSSGCREGRRCFVTTARRDFCYAGDLAASCRACHRRHRHRHLSLFLRQGRNDQASSMMRSSTP